MFVFLAQILMNLCTEVHGVGEVYEHMVCWILISSRVSHIYGIKSSLESRTFQCSTTIYYTQVIYSYYMQFFY